MTAHRSSATDGTDDARSAAAESSAAQAAEAPASAADRPPQTYPLPPGPDGYPIVGNTLAFARDPFAFFDELATYGDVVRYRVAGRRFTTLLAPEYVERVLVEEPERFERYLFGDRGFDFAPEGILFSEGEQWRTQRTLMQPAFTVDRIRSYADTMVEHAERTADEWDDGQVVALNRAFSDLTLRILSSALFDIDADPNADGEPITRAANVINERGDSRRLTTFLPYWLPTPGNIRYRRAMAAYRDRVDELIAERRAADSSAGGTDDGPETGTDTDLLSLLLRAENDGDTLSEEEIRDNLITFLFAGHETTSLGLTYTCMLLARHDEVATRLRRELETVLDGDAPRFEHVPRLEYTEQVIREAMRLYPPAYVQFRRATEDAAIGGYRIPEGTILSLPQFRLHTDERFYDTPEEFRPERWADDGVDGGDSGDGDANTTANADTATDTDTATDDDRPEYAYFPFGGGPRHCIGMRFAMLEMQLVVATLVQQFDLTLVSDPEPELTVGATLQPDEDVTVRLHRRS